ncbi:hypothetical protein B0H13DRAFT_2292963 [Mycena leptocephala]|nr:hypothetical protein B0H13DRAFT_2292963 [Mycena leptocephala]
MKTGCARILRSAVEMEVEMDTAHSRISVEMEMKERVCVNNADTALCAREEEEGEGGREGGGAVDAAPACTCRCVLRMRMETEACNAMDVEAGTCTRAWNAGSLSHCLRARLPRGAWCTDAEKHIRPCTPGSEYDFGCGRVHLRVGGGEDGECGVCAAAADVHAHTNPRDGEAEAWPYVSHWARTSAHAPSQLQRASTARANDGTLLPPAETCP